MAKLVTHLLAMAALWVKGMRSTWYVACTVSKRKISSMLMALQFLWLHFLTESYNEQVSTCYTVLLALGEEREEVQFILGQLTEGGGGAVPVKRP